jgi:hypothetical protein
VTDLPASIRVGALVYQVCEDAETLRDAERSEGTGIYGAANHRRLIIAVDRTVPPGQQRDTLWHEVKHCVNYLAAFGGKDKLGEEEVVERTCSLELLVLRDNPSLVAFLLAEEPQ